jgi:hypothetical protein
MTGLKVEQNNKDKIAGKVIEGMQKQVISSSTKRKTFGGI